MSDATCNDFASLAASHRKAGWLGFLARLVETIETRRTLAGLDDRMLSDIGLSRADALREAERRPWDVGPPGDDGRPRRG